MALKQKVMKGFFWVLLERGSIQIIGFVVSMILARLLTPKDYGTVALLSIFIALTGTLVESGLGTALIQKKEATELDFNSVFYLSLVASFIGYTVLFFIAPWIARYYAIPILVPILRIQALGLILGAISGIQFIILVKNLLFNLSFKINLISSIVQASLGIGLAFCGYGVWALVWSSLGVSVVSIGTRCFFIGWRPKWMFSWHSVSELFCGGWKFLFLELLGAGYNNLYGILIAKMYSPVELAFVDKGRAMPTIAMTSVNETISRVAFPAVVQIQDQREVVRATLHRMIQCSTFFIFPLMTGIALCARPLTLLLLGDQWEKSIPYTQVFCFFFALCPFYTVNSIGIMALKRNSTMLYVDIIKKVVGISLLLGSIQYGVFWMIVVDAFIGGPLNVVISAWPNRRLLGYTLSMQLKATFPTIIVCIIMSIFVYSVSFLKLLPWVMLMIQATVGILVFMGVAWLARLKPLCEYAILIKPYLEPRLSPRLWPLWRRFIKRLEMV